MMKSKVFNASIRYDLETTGKTIANIALHIDFLDYIYNHASDGEKEAFNSYQIFWRLRDAFWSVAILDLNKIYSFSRNDNYSLLVITEKLINSYNLVRWENKIELSELDLLKQRLQGRSEQIQKLRNARDQFVAHLDKKRKKIELRLDDLKELLLLGQKLFNEIDLSLNNASVSWEFSRSQKGYQVFGDLDKYKRIMELIQKDPSGYLNEKDILT